ncbi:MAG TPA: hypothetical protein VFI65_31235 [Streptosporangiaceae bacterium]|nr:hypothetical protein [Streptosporangiaceae bacterium]
MVIRRNGGGLAVLGMGALALGTTFLPVTGASAATKSTSETTMSARATLVCPDVLPSKEATLNGVATVSAKNAWAVGSNQAGPIVEHFNGSKWSLVKAPVLNSALGEFFAAAAFPGGAWAVGTTDGETGGGQPFIYRLTGTSKVQKMSLPKLGHGRLINVSVTSAKDAWAGGFLGHGTELLLHWNGTAWKRVSFPGKGLISSVLGLTAKNVWVADRGFNGNTPAQVWNWNGKKWRQTAIPAANGKFGYTIESFSANSGKDIWGVGWFLDETDIVSFTVSIHWNGTKWSLVKTPALPMTDGARLLAVAAISPKNVWAVGDNVHFPAVIEHWNGKAWKVVKSPACGGLLSISLEPGGNGWAVGAEADAQDNIPVIFQKTDNTWKSVTVGS